MTRWRTRIATVVLLLPLVTGMAVAATPAYAHSELRSAAPADNDRLTTVPKEIRLTFNERIDPRFVRLAVTSTQGRAVESGGPTVSGVVVSQPLSNLPNGDYTVAWRVVSVDGHPVQGTVRFTVAAPGGGSAGGRSTGGAGNPRESRAAANAPGLGTNLANEAAGMPYREIGFISVFFGLLGVIYFLNRGRRTKTAKAPVDGIPDDRPKVVAWRE